ncbi:E4 SUMO-protein ligase PIAL2-like [Mangifera indica]|uniref:E4 SUMO-protein ligase PIAL2-like n=1 Tax=Mangifera indica TaxID=29780 RepID=UPI001CFC12F1|nr:E4 SUMO-protein ligase PIAL2-like [Mangifera indica]
MGVGHQLSASLVNSVRVTAVAERLASHILHPGTKSGIMEFFNLCVSLARGIDYAVAHNEVPVKAQELPQLLKQVCQQRSTLLLKGAIMVLMISVKNACKMGWFSDMDSQELLTLADEIGSGFSRHGDIKAGPSNLVSTISTIMTMFYPQMKMGPMLASLEVKPGYGAYMIDFAISKRTVHSPSEIRLFVAQTDNIETSACIISPQEANFLLNGKGVDRRTNVLMDPGPQLPTNVTAMLKYGTNLLQAVGQFNGHYIVAVAFMSMEPSLDTSSLQDYVQSDIAVKDSDSDVIEGPSRVSLNCPISYTRIRTPVKGKACKHLQTILALSALQSACLLH